MNLPNFSIDNNYSYSNRSLVSLICSSPVHCDANQTAAPVISGSDASTQNAEPLYCLIFLQKGGGFFRIKNKTTALPAGSLLFLTCDKDLRFRAAEAGMEAWFFCFSGQVLPYYYDIVCSYTENALTLAPDSPLLASLNFLIQLKQSHSLTEELMVTDHVTRLLAEYIRLAETGDLLPPAAPSYLQQIKQEFDLHCERNFSLENLAAVGRVSKYRLCRDFTKYYGTSPIRYLNQVRIQKACLLLISTDMHVGEIAAAVGIENPNHFIRLFKGSLHMTPLEYRRHLHA